MSEEGTRRETGSRKRAGNRGIISRGWDDNSGGWRRGSRGRSRSRSMGSQVGLLLPNVVVPSVLLLIGQ